MTAKTKLRLFFSGVKVTRPASADDREPKWNLMVPLGPHYRQDLPGGKIDVTPSMLETMRANWQRAGKPRVRGDYFHMGGTDVPNVPLENKIASGWAVDLKCDDKGLWSLIDWTDKARDFILKDELASLSPEIYFNPVDRNTGERQGPTLTSFGLLNDPSFQNLPHVAAAAPSPEENTMDKKLLCAALGLPESASDADIAKALETQKTQLGELKALNEKLTASAKAAEDEKVKLAAAGDDKVKVLSAELVKVSSSVDELRKDNEALKKAGAEKAKMDLCAKLEREGRIIAADKGRIGKLVDSMGLDEATKFTATLPVKVDISERGHGEGGVEGGELSKAEAHKQFTAKVDELKAKEPSLKASELYARVKAAHPDIAKAAFARN